ncbi:uncharacterized protein LOC114758386 [Neltuma alba]|uniref:uncharacterized protein LOC114758386 n=1 Tax=Neltuma alba TaxID=207710 RepID=UPI0010A500FE|nr:uncharacterized protein LOC114758386 [Prosopis alba]
MANKTWVVSVVFCFLFSFVHITKAGQDRVAKAKELEAAKLLNKMNKSAVKSLKSPDGDIIDCVHILHQPAFDHPKLKNHKIQYATTEVKKDKYYGAKATINVWRTHVQQHSEYSLSQIWVINQDDNDNVESVEGGWQVNPLLCGDDKPRFYAYWTSDSYGRTGCYNLRCSGFVQVSNIVALGAIIQPLSIYGGTQYDISLLIWKDPRSGNWWLRAQDINMGYWLASMLDSRSESATIVQWGSEEIYTIEMGSGYFSKEGYGKAGYFEQLSTVNENNTLVTPDNFKVFASKPIDLKPVINGDVRFSYGGPGRNSNCPI